MLHVILHDKESPFPIAGRPHLLAKEIAEIENLVLGQVAFSCAGLIDKRLDRGHDICGALPPRTKRQQCPASRCQSGNRFSLLLGWASDRAAPNRFGWGTIPHDAGPGWALSVFSTQGLLGFGARRLVFVLECPTQRLNGDIELVRYASQCRHGLHLDANVLIVQHGR